MCPRCLLRYVSIQEMFLFVWFIFMFFVFLLLYIGCCLSGREFLLLLSNLFFLGRNEEVNRNDTRNLTTCGLCTDTEGHPAGWRPLFLWPPLIASFKGVSLLNTRVSDKGREGHEWCWRSLNIALYVEDPFMWRTLQDAHSRIKRIVSHLKRDLLTEVFATTVPPNSENWLLRSFITKFCIIDTCIYISA